MVAGFTLFTIFAVFALYRTEYGITRSQLATGLQFKLPENFITAFAAFGVIGVGAAELIYYPYWCLEKAMPASLAPRKILRSGRHGRRAGCVCSSGMPGYPWSSILEPP